MKADRLLSALLLLQSHGRLTGRELSRRLEVSMRTVHRDMEALGSAGVPVFALRGARGGWQLDEGWRTRVPGLDAGELRALLMAQPRALGDSRLVRAAERALEKLMAALPTPLRDEANSMRQRLHVDTTGWRGAPEDLAALPVVEQAVSHDRRLALLYRARGKERVERTVDPLGLVAKGGVWYLVAGTPEGLRTFRISRIESAAVLPEPSLRPAGFDLAAYWSESTEALRRELRRYEATLLLEARALASIEPWRPCTRLSEADAGGQVTVRVAFEDEEQACFVVLGFGPRAEVLEPAALKARVASDIAAMARRMAASA